MNRFKKLLILSVIFIFMLTGCINNDLPKQREKDVGKEKTILIGVPVPLEFAQQNTKFLKGLELALEEINAEGINGKQIALDIRDDEGNFKKAVDIAQEFSKNTRMIAVIGHWFSDICIPISNIYEKAGMLTIVPTVSNPELTQNRYKYVFQNITSDNSIAQAMNVYANSHGYKRAVIYYEDSSYGRNLAHAIEKKASENNIEIVDRRTGLATTGHLMKAHEKWKAMEFDAVLLALNMPEGAQFINQLRNINKDVAIISADGLDVENFIEVMGKDAEGIVIITSYNPYHYTPELEQFTEKYINKYSENPDLWAIQGYESLQIIAYAIKQTESYSPASLANYMRDIERIKTTLGEISFNESGEISGRDTYQKVVVDGQFKYVD